MNILFVIAVIVALLVLLSWFLIEACDALSDYWRGKGDVEPSGPVWHQATQGNPDMWTLQARHIRVMGFEGWMPDYSYLRLPSWASRVRNERY